MAAQKSTARKATTRATTKPVRAQRKAPAARKSVAAKKPTAESVARKIVRFTTGQTARAKQRDFYTDDCVSYEPGAEPIVGLAALEEKWEADVPIQQATEWRALQVLVKSQTICIEWEAVVPGSDGSRAPFREMAVYQLRNGAIAEERYYYDPAALGSGAPEAEAEAAAEVEAEPEAAAEAAEPAAQPDEGAAPAEAPPVRRHPPTPNIPAVDFRGHPPIDPLDL